MGALAPGLLLLGLAAAVPILLHLLHRQPGPRRVFPALRYLRQAERESARRVRLRQLLLLALRVGAVLLLALAAARPFLPGGSAEHPPTAVALVLDNSLSTGLVQGDERMLDGLKARALATLERAGAEDRFWVVRAAEPSTPAAPLDAARAAERVRETEVVAARADLAEALRRARGLLAAGAQGRPAEIQLLSDLQATALPEPVEGSGDAGPALLVWAPDAEAPPNAGVVAVEVGGGLAPRAGQRSSVAARVEGGGDSVTVRLLLAGRVRAAAAAPPGATVLLPFPAHPEGTVTGAVEIDADALRGDDRRWFVARVAPPPSVALTAAAPFLEDALEVLAASGRIRRAAPGNARVRLAPGGVGAEGLREGVSVVVLPPASPLELPALNRRLAAGGI
ncbi:MAG TPA: BatA domain-containing protein, partial [Longimicrobiales bacterium]|nr:BatA domain-containing protein [Longimicrobiales bacterium]